MNDARFLAILRAARQQYPNGVIVDAGDELIPFSPDKNGKLKAAHSAFASIFAANYPTVRVEQLLAQQPPAADADPQ